MLKRFIIVYVVLLSSTVFARYEIGSKQTENFTTETLIEIINSSAEEKSIPSVLSDLHQYYPELFSNYILMYKSRSLQKSSFLYPRVLLNSKDSKTIISFNGNPKDHGYNNLEVVEFDEKEDRFKFREISFFDGKAKVSEVNPKKCLRCHQSSSRKNVDPRPNWEPYNMWPGAYDSTGHGSDFIRKGSDKFDPHLYNLFSQENEMYQKFLDTVASNHDRYKYLVPIAKNTSGLYFPSLTAASGSKGPHHLTTALTEQLGLLNTRRIVRLIKTSPLMEFYKETVLGAFRCDKMFMPKDLLNWHKSKTNMEPVNLNVDSTNKILSFIFEAHDVDTSDWSMDFGTGAKFAFRERFGMPTNFERPFFQKLKEALVEKGSKLNCEDLEKESLRKLQEAWNQDLLLFDKEVKVKAPLINSCTRCHSEYSFNNAPVIPFDNQDQLKIMLKKTGYKRGTLYEEILYRVGPHATFDERMPANGYIPRSDELKEFKETLESLYFNSAQD